MKILVRCLREYRGLKRVWLPLLLVAAIVPIIAVSTPLVEKRLIDGVILAHRPGLLPGIAALYAGLWLSSTILFIIAFGLRVYLAERLALHLRQRLFVHAGQLSLAFAHREHSGRTASLFVNDVPAVTDLFSTVIVDGLSSFMAVALAVVTMVLLNGQLALAAICGPFIAVAASAFITRPLRPAARHAQEQAAQIFERIHEHLAGIREVVAFGQLGRQESQFLKSLQELLRLRLRVTLIDTGIQSGTSILSLVVTLSILIYGAYLVIEGRTTLGTVIAMRSLFNLLFVPTRQLAGMFSSAQKSLGAADRIYAFLDQRPTVEELGSARAPADVRGEVTFDHVNFGYTPDRPVLHDISMTAHPGEMIALVGPSGAGKSTIMSLLARFYDPAEGRILLDGEDVRGLTLLGLREHIGIVFQDTFLFATTIRENITLGRADVNDERLMAVARASNAWEFIEDLKEGFETQVGERGVHLSEGQKQRIAIARALMKEPRVLILDEPTSALDARSEHLLQSALDNLMRGRTTFVIAHRLATIQRADRIVVIDRGRIVEQGTHAALLQRGGIYRELFELQFASPASMVDA